MSPPTQYTSEEFGEFGSWGQGFPLPGVAKLLEVHGFNPTATAYYFALVAGPAAPVAAQALLQPILVPGGSEFSWVPWGTGWGGDVSNYFSFGWVVSSDPQTWVNPAVDFFVSGTLSYQFP